MGSILITGGAGYIGSHIVKKLGQDGYAVTTYDNLSSGYEWAVLHGELIIGDIRDSGKLRETFENREIEAVIHLAAHIVAPESVSAPLKYYDNNVGGTLSLLSVMQEYGVKTLIFSSTAAVYGIPQQLPVPENAPLRPINPYGRGKAMVERILQDLNDSGQINYVALRYFNVAGADPLGMTGDGKPTSTHLITSCLRTAAGLQKKLQVFGTDYPTFDGTCIRDYIHVEDLANAHVLALQHLQNGGQGGIFNCGYGRGYSVLEVVEAVKKVTGIPFAIYCTKRRPGDPPALVADPARIKNCLGWQPRHDSLEHIIDTAWKWELKRIKKGLS